MVEYSFGNTSHRCCSCTIGKSDQYDNCWTKWEIEHSRWCLWSTGLFLLRHIDSIMNQFQSLLPNLLLFFNHFGFDNVNFPANETVFQAALNDYITFVGVTGWNAVQGWVTIVYKLSNSLKMVDRPSRQHRCCKFCCLHTMAKHLDGY